MTRKERRWEKSKNNPSNIQTNKWIEMSRSIAIINARGLRIYLGIKSKHTLRKLKKGYLRVRGSHDKGDVISIKIRKDRGPDSPSAI